MKRTFVFYGLLLGCGWGLAEVAPSLPPNARPISASSARHQVSEQPVVPIAIAGPVADRISEVSGLAWYGDYLIILPQYPDRFGEDGSGQIFALPKAEILAYLQDAQAQPLEPRPIPFNMVGLVDRIEGFEGFEAIHFAGEKAFFTIETHQQGTMGSYLVTGTLAADLSTLTLDATRQAWIPAQTTVENMADEALLVAGETVLSFDEANGASLNPLPVAHSFDLALQPSKTIPFPHIEYRITDATAMDTAGRFWAINYFFPGDRDLLPEVDPLMERYGLGASHRISEVVERLVELQYSETGITLTDTPPIQLQLGREGRNWEGIARLDDQGFLLMTDKFPGTLLGFVERPES